MDIFWNVPPNPNHPIPATGIEPDHWASLEFRMIALRSEHDTTSTTQSHYKPTGANQPRGFFRQLTVHGDDPGFRGAATRRWECLLPRHRGGPS